MTVKRIIGVTETSGLKGHVRTCKVGNGQEMLEGFGITGGHPNRLLPEQVREWFAVWMAESAQPFSQAKDRGVSTPQFVRDAGSHPVYSFVNCFTRTLANTYLIRIRLAVISRRYMKRRN
jgi:hypothetical protein